MLVGYAATLAAILACLLPAAAQAAPQVVVAFHPGGEQMPVFHSLAARAELSLGFLGATQGPYTRRQALLDIAAGNRVSRSGYEPPEPPRYALRGTAIANWQAIAARARSAPTDIVPGLLASSVPRGAAFVGLTRRGALEAVVAADRDGTVDAVSLGDGATVADRTEAALRSHDLVVAVLPPGDLGDAQLDALLARRPAERLLLVIRRPPRSDAAQMLPFGAAGLEGGGLLTSRTTRREGLVAGTDIAPTVLEWLGQPVPGAVRGRAISATGERDVAALRKLERRLRVVYPRRFPSLFAVVGALVLVAVALPLAGGRAGRKAALRLCALALLWIPAVSLLGAALALPRTGELLLMGLGTLVLAAVTDRLLPWPRGPALPALLGTVAYLADLVQGSDLIVRSLLGPNPRFGSRFYGIGNELEATLPVLLLIGLAAIAGRRGRSRGLAAAFGGAMLVLGLAVGAGRLGADVGGVITAGAAGAVAVVLLLPGRPSRRALAFALAVPALAVLALAAIDLVTGGDAHFTGTVLKAEDTGALWDTAARRYGLAWNALWRGYMPLVTLAAVALAVWGVRRRRPLYAAVADRPAWLAALGGGLAGSVLGALTNDSGPILLVIGTVVLGAATAYVRGNPDGVPAAEEAGTTDVRTVEPRERALG
jgi:hypothetical protein